MIRLPPCKIGIIDSERQIALVLNQCKVIVAASRIGGSSGLRCGTGIISRCCRNRSGRHRRAHTSSGILGFGSNKINVTGHDLDRSAVVAVLILIVTALQTAINGNHGTFLEITADKLSGAVPGNNIKEVGLVLAIGIAFSEAGAIVFTVGGATISLSGLAVASIVGIVLNAVLPGNDYVFGVSVEGDKSADLGSY